MDLTGTVFAGANLDGALLARARLIGADLSGAMFLTGNAASVVDTHGGSVGFQNNGTQSGARYNWVEECGCFPAGVFGARGNGTTLAQDRSRLAQLRRDGWLGLRRDGAASRAGLLRHRGPGHGWFHGDDR